MWSCRAAPFYVLTSSLLKSVEQGAATTIYAATAPELEATPGAYLAGRQAPHHGCIIIIGTGLESHTRCASRAHEVRLYVP